MATALVRLISTAWMLLAAVDATAQIPKPCMLTVEGRAAAARANRQTGTPVRRSTSARVTTVAISSTATSCGLPRGCTPQTAVVDEWSSAPLQRMRPRWSRPYVM